MGVLMGVLMEMPLRFPESWRIVCWKRVFAEHNSTEPCWGGDRILTRLSKESSMLPTRLSILVKSAKNPPRTPKISKIDSDVSLYRYI